MTAPEPPVLPAIPARHPVQFHGDAREFFRIWIVNTLLTLLSAGLFLAWAKVRKRRYLRGCTEIMGHRFDYRAHPSRILVGNLIVLVFFLGYTLFGVVYPPIRYGVMLVFLHPRGGPGQARAGGIFDRGNACPSHWWCRPCWDCSLPWRRRRLRPT